MPVFLPFSSDIFRNTSFPCIDSQTFSDTKVTTLIKTKKPPMYKVVMLNDDFTPMDFVIYVLESFFQKNNEDAMKIMFKVHNNGSANCGVFTYEIAEAKQNQTIQFARKHQYPLQCILEKE